MENWPENQGQLEKVFEFPNFLSAVDFVNKVAELAEEADHHPDIFIHSFKKVRIQLMTHSEGKITQRDHNLAEKIDLIIQDQ